MTRKPYVLDTSALLALIESEEGADRVESLLRGEAVLLPCLTLLEVHYVTRQERGQGEADRRYALRATGERSHRGLGEALLRRSSYDRRRLHEVRR